MSGSLRLALILLAVVFGGWIAYGVLKAVLSLLVPVVALAAIVGVVYMVTNKKALGGGRRTLP